MLFEKIVGQEQTKQLLRKQALSGQIPHAQLLCGMEGIGKLGLALAFVQYLFCTDRHEGDACGICPSCHKVQQLIHPDLHFVYPIIKQKQHESCESYLPEWREITTESPYFTLSQWSQQMNGENKLALIPTSEGDEVIKRLALKSLVADYKVTIIWHPEKMNTQCANKLLKLIEEPYDRTLFLLISNAPDEIITTIQSRTQRINVPPLAAETIASALTDLRYIAPEKATEIARIANGSMTSAFTTIAGSQEDETMQLLFEQAMRNSWKRDVKTMKAWAEEIHSNGREFQKRLLAFMLRAIRENYIYNLRITTINYQRSNEAAFSSKFSPYINERNVEEFIEQFERAEREISQNVSAKIVFFDLSLHIAVLLKK